MTILIASRTGILADSKVTTGSVSYRTNKILRYKGELIGLAGDHRGLEKFLRWYKGRRGKMFDTSDDEAFEVVVVNKRGMWVYINCTLPEQPHGDYYYAGAGDAAAEAAMLAGASPRRAIEIACQVINSCGLPIQEEKL